jgi:hypothetical protein
LSDGHSEIIPFFDSELHHVQMMKVWLVPTLTDFLIKEPSGTCIPSRTYRGQI